MRRYFSIVLILLVVYSCKTSNEAIPTKKVVTQAELNEFLGGEDVIFTRGYLQTHPNMPMTAYSPVQTTIGKQFVEDWRSLHKINVEAVNNNKYIDRQLTACFMLDEILLKQETTPEVQEAISYYTKQLMVNKNLEYTIVSRSLEKLKGYWPAQQISQAAKQQLELAQLEKSAFDTYLKSTSDGSSSKVDHEKVNGRIEANRVGSESLSKLLN